MAILTAVRSLAIVQMWELFSLKMGFGSAYVLPWYSVKNLGRA